MSNTCHQCGQPIQEDGPAGGICAPCLWRMKDDKTVLIDSPVTGLPEVAGHVILGEISRGGMGIVYKAKQLDPEREVALKMLLPLDERREDLLQRFRVEVHALAELDHPGILPLYQVGSSGGRPWFTMKLASGGTLASRLGRRRKTFDPIEAAKLMASMADAVHHAHSHGFLHRDIKPANILFDERGDAFLADFGLAKLLDSTAHVTRSQVVLGTPCYMAPEVASKGAKAATTASDLYSLGAVLYELLSGRPPFMIEGMAALVKKIVEDEPERPSTLAANVPRDLELVCLTCLAKDPRQRYATAKDAADDLRRWLNGEPVAARRAGTIARLWSWSRRRPAVAGLAAALALTLLGSSVWLSISSVQLRQSLAEEKKARDRADAQSEFLIGEFADGLERLGRLGLIEEACANAEKNDAPNDDAGHRRRARLLLRWAAANWARGDAPGAARRLKEVILSMDELHARQPEDIPAFTMSLEARCRLADVTSETTSFAEAFRLLDSATALLEKPGALPLNEALRIQYEIDRTRSVLCTRQESESERALKFAQSAAASCRLWQNRDPGDDRRTLELASSLRKYGAAVFNHHPDGDNEPLEAKESRLSSALAIFTEARDLMKPLIARSPRHAAWEFEYAQNTGWMGAMLRRQASARREAGRSEEAAALNAEAKAALLTEKEWMSLLVNRDQLNWYWQLKLSDSDWALARFHDENGDRELAARHRAWRRERLALIGSFAPDVRSWNLSKLGAAVSAGSDLLKKGEKAAAAECFMEALTQGHALVTRQPASRTEQDGWRNLIYGVAQQWLEAGEIDKSVETYEQALKICNEQARASLAVEWWQWTAGSLERRLADALAPTDLKQAVQANLRSFRHRAHLLRARWFRALEDPLAIPNSFKEAERLQRECGLLADALKDAAELLNLFISCRDAAGPVHVWAKPLVEVVEACIDSRDPGLIEARVLAERAANEFYPPATRANLAPPDQKMLKKLASLASSQ
jgi:tetratricopeptide (TPR) repeat protein